MLENILDEGIAALGLEVSAQQRQQLLDYVRLLDKWNHTYNLTAIRDPREMVVKHLLDALAVVPYVEGETIADVGTGPGIPGIMLAIMFPTKKFVLLDSNGKKIRFVRQAVRELGLKNVQAEQIRLEDYHPQPLFDAMISRAFTEIENMLRMGGNIVKPEGQLLAMKGKYPAAELESLPAGYRLETVHKLLVPALDSDRHLVVIKHG